MRHRLIWFFALALALAATVSACLAEDGLAGTLTQAGIDAEALFAEAPLIEDVRIDEGVLSFSVGELSEIYLDFYGEDGESAAQFSLEDFTYQDGVWTVRSEAISPELSFDIGVGSEVGYGQYTSLTDEARAWVEDDTICLYDDGTITIQTEDELSLTYGGDGRLTSYTYHDEDGLAYTYTVGGRLLSMEGIIDELGGEVAWSAEDGWYIWQQEGEEEGEWARMSEEQIALALPYARYAEARQVSWERQWYPNNTACVMGLSLREMDPALTDKWYNILPVRVDRDGKQIFPLVASNLYIVGSVTVTVRGDWVTVTYKYLGNDDMQNLGETVAWFTSMDQVTADYLANPESNCRFGRRLSREKDLNGQPAALLFICNRLTYAQPFNETGTLLTRYWPNHPRYVKYRENLNNIMGELR